MKWRAFADSALDLLFPPHCEGCGELLAFGRAGELCPDCAAKLEKEAAVACPLCGYPAADCRCGDMDGQIPLALYFYTKNPERLSEQIVFHMKDSPLSRGDRLFARELARHALLALAERGEKPEAYFVTYVPRSPENKRKTGVDQGRRLARAFAAYTGMHFLEGFVRQPSTEQKGLQAEERAANVRASLRLKPGVDITGKRLYLLDDIITTGATVRTAAQMLRSVGADKIYIAAVFRTLPHRYEKPAEEAPLWFQT